MPVLIHMYTLRPFYTALLWLLLVLMLSSCNTLETSSQETSYGYVEGTLISQDLAQQSARVRLADQREIEAFMGISLPEDSQGQSSASPVILKHGQRIVLYFSQTPDGIVQYTVVDWVRRPVLLALVGLFLLVAVLVARLKGLRAFLATAASLAVVTLYIIPSILNGHNPVLVSLIGIGIMLLFAIYFVHGLSWSTTAAILGTFLAVAVTMALGWFFSNLAHLTGFNNEEALMLNVSAGHVSLKGLFLAGLLVGALGALTDITIVQASVVRELAHLNPKFRVLDLYTRGMNVGYDHIGSLVNTLVLAYVGSSLPLLLLLRLRDDIGVMQLLNLELVASEIIHTLVGSIGLVLAVPLTTFIAAAMFKGGRLPITQQEREIGHSHGLSLEDSRALQRQRQLHLLDAISQEEAEEELDKRLRR